jgi:hypothetical protein
MVPPGVVTDLIIGLDLCKLLASQNLGHSPTVSILSRFQLRAPLSNVLCLLLIAVLI